MRALRLTLGAYVLGFVLYMTVAYGLRFFVVAVQHGGLF